MLPELWGGLECTVNRTASGYRDQCSLSGHDLRIDDLDRFAELGLEAIRYPVLWERTAPDRDSEPDWRWADARLTRLDALSIRPIIGLLHHGSGPAHTDLLDEGFADGLGRFAEQVAERYPGVRDWTPVNEPVTTARFAALYGHWYPHRRDERSFWLALVNQVDGTRAAMRAIRKINPEARLIQTDDLGRTFATAAMTDQAAFDNLRRWAGWDLLFGRVTTHHPLWKRLASFGLTERLARIADTPCPPDIIGVNHYLTSDRFLDHRLERYPTATHGGNGRERYADTEAIRVLAPPPPGLRGALEEAWHRYATPLAITEVHNGCTREEQLRWAAESWDTACALGERGVDVRAVTAWSLLGSHGWDRLLTGAGSYESGLYDVSEGRPRPTALAPLWQGLPNGALRHPVAIPLGWWHRPDRLLHRPVLWPSPVRPSAVLEPPPPLMICGATGWLGQAFVQACLRRGIPYVSNDQAKIVPARADGFRNIQPWAVVYAVGWIGDENPEPDEAAYDGADTTNSATLAAACAAADIGFLCFSADPLIGGRPVCQYIGKNRPPPPDLNRLVIAVPRCDGSHSRGAPSIHATGPFMSDAPRSDLMSTTGFAGNTIENPGVASAFLSDLTDQALDLLIDGETGPWQLTNGATAEYAAANQEYHKTKLVRSA